jgi:glutamate-1-semialdehyde 2,1-aminomutase
VNVPGFSSTGSKRPDALYGEGASADLPTLMLRSAGCRVWDVEGREYLDFIMALGAVALGYGHPVVNRAAIEAIAGGVVGSLSPGSEEALATELGRAIPWLENTRFLKTGAEAAAAAVRIARAWSGREMVLGCGYHGWHDWCRAADSAVPAGTQAAFQALRFDDGDDLRRQVRVHGDRLAAIIVEPVIEREPSRQWLEALREETTRAGIVLIFDEIKTGFRLAIGGAAERYGVHPDLVVLGKAMANGFPLAVVGGRADIMSAVSRTWISSTLATETVALAAGRATLEVMIAEGVPVRLGVVGAMLMDGLRSLQDKYPGRIVAVRGIPEMCYLEYRDDQTSASVARGCARRNLLFKRSAYNFVSLAHQPAEIKQAQGKLDEVLVEM